MATVNMATITPNQDLSGSHITELKASAISDEVIKARGYRTTHPGEVLPREFSKTQQGLNGLLIPIRNLTGEVVTHQLKPEHPRTNEQNKPIKYETASGAPICLDIPADRVTEILDDSKTLWITEGSKKVDSAISKGLDAVIGLLGVWSWVSNKGTVLPDWRDIPLTGRQVVIAFDSDVMTKETVRSALDQLADYLSYRGAHVSFCIMPPLPDGSKCGLDDWFAAGNSRDQLWTRVVPELPDPIPDWDTPVPLITLEGKPFPENVFHEAIQTYVEAVTEQTQTPYDLSAIVALGTISAAAGGKFEIEGMDGWTEPVHIHALAVAGSGMRKSAVFSEITKPLRDWEKLQRDSERYSIESWESQQRVLESSLRSAEKKAINHSTEQSLSDPEVLRMAAVEELTNHSKRRVYPTRVLLDDATPEAATSHLVQQHGAIAVMSAEAAFLQNISGQYGNSPNYELMLKGHAGESLVVDRIGRDSEYVSRACLTLCLAVQPRVIEDLLNVKGFDDRGGIARLLPGFVPDFRGYENLHPHPIAEPQRNVWRQWIQSLLDLPKETGESGKQTPRLLRLGSDAQSLFHDYRAQLQLRVRQGGQMHHMIEWASKLPGQTLRIAGLLHLSQSTNPEQCDVGGEVMENAIRIAEYFSDHAEIMYRMRRGRGSHSLAKSLLTRILEMGPKFTRRELARRVCNTYEFPKTKDLDQPLQTLEDHGYIRRQISKPSSGRPSETICVNPLVLASDDNRITNDPMGGFGSFVRNLSNHETQSDTHANQSSFSGFAPSCGAKRLDPTG